MADVLAAGRTAGGPPAGQLSDTRQAPDLKLRPERPPTWPRVELGGTPVDLLDWEDALRLILTRAQADAGPALAVASANLDHIHHFGVGGPSHDLTGGWTHAAGGAPGAGVPGTLQWLTLLDGAPLVTQAAALTGRHWPRLAGSDLIDPILDGAERAGLSVGFLGGSQQTQQLLQQRLATDRPHLRVTGWWAPDRAQVTDPASAARLATAIGQAPPDILVVGLGKPRQERWIAEHGAASGARVLLAFGAVVDFLAGQVSRAPTWVRDHGLEWAWRLGLEPRRLARRYLVEGPPSYLALRRHSHLVDPGGAGAGRPGGAGAGSPGGPDGEAPAHTAPAALAATFAGPGEPARVAVLVVTHNNGADLDPLLGSLRREAARVPLRVVVVDNASTDDTLAQARAHPDVIAVDSGGNLGYAGGINVAARHAGPVEALLILNPDLVVLPGAVAALVDRLAAHPEAGAVVPMLLDHDGTVFPSLRREPGPLRSLGEALLGARLPRRPAALSDTVRDQTSYAGPHPIDWASGAAVLVRASAAAAVGEWDERFFLYSEETDYFRRLRDAGWQAWYEPAGRMQHRQGGSGGSPQLAALMEVNRVRYQQLHATPTRAALTRGAVLLGSLLRSGDPGHRAAVGPLLSRRRWAGLPHAWAPTPVVAPTERPAAVPTQRPGVVPTQRHSVAPTPEVPEPPVRGSVVIPAHNEAAVIGRTLTPLAPLIGDGALEVVVVCNGCTDGTAREAARFPGVRVVEIAQASKTAALRVGDTVASRWPRLYLDADVQIVPATVREVLAALSDDGPRAQSALRAARPAATYDTAGAHWLVRSYYRARRRIPGVHGHLWGAGAYGVSRAGRARWGDFPDVVADDLWVDSLFASDEKAVVGTVPAIVRVPRTVPDLLGVLRRAQRGKAHLVARGDVAESARGTVRELAGTVRGIRSGVDGLTYSALSILARLGATPGAGTWERDDSSRR